MKKFIMGIFCGLIVNEYLDLLFPDVAKPFPKEDLQDWICQRCGGDTYISSKYTHCSVCGSPRSYPK